MAVRIFARYSCSLMQCLKYTAHSKIPIVEGNNFVGIFSNNVGRCRTFHDDSGSGNKAGKKNTGSNQSRVTLVLPNGQSRLLTLTQAKDIANKNNSELIDVRDEFGSYTVYRLVPLKTSNGQNQAAKDAKPKEKQPKVIEMHTTITERDLLIKCKKIVKIVQSNQKVRVSLYNAEKEQKSSKTSVKEIKEIIAREIQDFGVIKEESTSEKVSRLLVVPQKKDVQQE